MSDNMETVWPFSMGKVRYDDNNGIKKVVWDLPEVWVDRSAGGQLRINGDEDGRTDNQSSSAYDFFTMMRWIIREKWEKNADLIKFAGGSGDSTEDNAAALDNNIKNQLQRQKHIRDELERSYTLFFTDETEERYNAMESKFAAQMDYYAKQVDRLKKVQGGT